MAGDWIKFEKSTLDKPEVFEMASILNIDPDAVVGKLLRVWNWFDDQSENGNAFVTVRPLLDRYSGVADFTEAMQTVGWLRIEGDIMSLPNFDRHNGKTAKNRCNTNRRVAKSRSKKDKCNTCSVTNVTPEALQKPLPEKRREEKRLSTKVDNPPLPPEGDEFKLIINKLFNRRASTKWSEKELRAYRKLDIDHEEMNLIEKYYDEVTGSKFRRKDVQTLLNNWLGEVDRARSWTPEGEKLQTETPNSRTIGTHNEGQTFGAGTNPNQIEIIPGLE